MVYTSSIRFPCVPSVYKSTHSGFNGDRRITTLSLFSKKDSFSRKIFAEKSSYDHDASQLKVAATGKVLVPGSQNNGSSSLTDQLETPEIMLKDSEVPPDADNLPMEDDEKVEIEELDHVSSAVSGNDENDQSEEPSFPLQGKVSTKKSEVKTESKPRSVPPPGIGQKIYQIDPTLTGYRQHLDYRYEQYKRLREEIDKYEGGLEVFSRGYEKLGFIRSDTGITYREWAPGAKSASLIGDFNNWNPNADIMTRAFT